MNIYPLLLQNQFDILLFVQNDYFVHTVIFDKKSLL